MVRIWGDRWVERPPLLYRLLYRDAVWRGTDYDPSGRPVVYLTFDDGPVPEVTPEVLDILDRRGVKATFFVVADNGVRHPGLLAAIKSRGHRLGNHTFHHLQGIRTATGRYLEDVALAHEVTQSRLFRAPHGLMRPAQYRQLSLKYRVVFHDLVTRDYSRHLGPDDVFGNVKRLARPGSVIVFHDSIKARTNVLGALERSIEWLKEQGYTFGFIDENDR